MLFLFFYLRSQVLIPQSAQTRTRAWTGTQDIVINLNELLARSAFSSSSVGFSLSFSKIKIEKTKKDKLITSPETTSSKGMIPKTNQMIAQKCPRYALYQTTKGTTKITEYGQTWSFFEKREGRSIVRTKIPYH